MSFICEDCKEATQIGEKINFVVTQKRDKVYNIWKIQIKNSRGKNEIRYVYKEPNQDDLENNRIKILKRIVSKGWETVKEKKLCNKCLIKGEKE